MNTVDSSSPSVLLRHDGELSDVRQLLGELGANYVETLGRDSRSVDPGDWDVVIASPQRIPYRHSSATASRAKLIAVVEGDSRTLRAHLQRMAVDMIVRRPVHPAALRLLILHTLYRGPERRRKQRVSIGAEVRFRSGLLRRRGTLTDLSLRGCRVQTCSPTRADEKIRLCLPARVTAERPLRLAATVMRCGPATGEAPGVSLMAVRFDDVTLKQTERLGRIIEAHLAGPAVLRGEPGRRHRDDELTQGRPPPLGFEPERGPAEAIGQPDDSDDSPGGERRGTTRHSYSQRVVALGDQATRVLLGRDISLGAMRVDPNPGLALGDRLQIALHAMARSEPLVIRARVQRDDGESGLVLCFDGLCAREIGELSKLIDHMPILTIDPTSAADEGSGLVISEILECQTG